MLRRFTAIPLIVLTAALAAAVAVAACARPQPSPDYERARALWNGLIQSRGTEAAQDPQADEVLALLDHVPRSSIDAEAAAALKKYITDERKARADEQARRDELLAKAGQAPSMPAPSASGEQQASTAATRPSPLAMGMKLEDFQAGYGACFHDQGPVELGGGPDGGFRTARMWSMNDDQDCRTKHANLVGQIVLFADGQLAGVNPATAPKKVEVTRDVQLGQLPDGGVGMRVDGKVVPLPPGAKVQVPDGGGGR